MRVEISGKTLELIQGDITNETTDVIVNAANNGLRGGGGVDGAIHAAAGPSVMKECEAIGGCATGSAVITNAGNLKVRKIIHTVGPIYRAGKIHVRHNLVSAYESSLELAVKNGLKSISFPSISTGAYGYPIVEASRVALETIIKFLSERSGIELVRIVLFSERDFDAYSDMLRRLTR